MSCCLYLLAATDLLLTTLRAVNFGQGSKPGLDKCWQDSNYDPLPVTMFCLLYNVTMSSTITCVLFLLRSLFAIILIIQRWRYPNCVMATWVTSQATELSMQIYTWISDDFWKMDPTSLLQFIFKSFIMWTFSNPRDSMSFSRKRRKERCINMSV